MDVSWFVVKCFLEFCSLVIFIILGCSVDYFVFVVSMIFVVGYVWLYDGVDLQKRDLKFVDKTCEVMDDIGK